MNTVRNTVAQVVSHPLDVAKTALQVDVDRKVHGRGALVPAMGRLFRERGVAGMYTGLVPRVMRGCGAFFVLSSLREWWIDNMTAAADAKLILLKQPCLCHTFEKSVIKGDHRSSSPLALSRSFPFREGIYDPLYRVPQGRPPGARS